MTSNIKQEHNKQKLLRNIDNIANNYLEVDGELLETIINEDKAMFVEVAGKNSKDEFLTTILHEYPDFTDELFELIQQKNIDKIDAMQRREKEQIRKVSDRKKKVVFTLARPGRLKAKKNNRQRWGRKEELKIRTLTRAGQKPKQIRENINQTRINNNETLRTDDSVNSKIKRVRKKDRGN